VNSKQLRYFIAVATEGTFTRASSKLRVAQPALSRQIAGTRRGIRHTDLGVRIIRYACACRTR
jgi:DNA-binding transcriptional LysR family regulator